MMIPPEYFDILGFPLFIILFIVGYKLRKTEKFASRFCMLLAILGFIADGYILITNFIL